MAKTLNTSALTLVTAVTADSPKGLRAVETFRAQYNKAGLSSERAQILNEDPDFAAYLAKGISLFSKRQPGDRNNYQRNGNGFECKDCGEEIMAINNAPYCPNCEKRPGSNGAPARNNQ